MNQRTLDEFKNRIAGEVITPTSPEYNDVRSVFNQTGSPAVVVRGQNNDDVVAAMRFARDNELTLAVRSGGHSPSGLSTNEGGLVIDLSHFNSVEVLDYQRHLVRIGAGAKWGDAAAALAEHGLAISSGDTKSVGVGGLTLGGGIGWLVRKVGLTIDSMVAAEIITADGRTLRVSDHEHPDLFWAIRGGGGNFGIVTSFDFRAHPLKSVVGGMVIYDLAEMRTVLSRWAAYMRGAPDELSATAVIFPGMGAQMPPQLFVLLCYGGDDEVAANRAIKPLLELGAVRQQDIQTKPYYKVLEDAMLPPGLKTVSDNGFIKTLDDEVLNVLTANYGQPGTAIIQIRSLGGAMARVSPDATAFAHRDYEAFVLAAAFVPVDTPPEQANRVREDAWRPLKPLTSGAYINFLTDASEPGVAAAYPAATYSRLASVKAAYDPDNVFNQNHNIKPVGEVTPR
jgi:FAD/FMN-containing dehydrogenase